MATPLLLVAAVPLFGNWTDSSRRNDETTVQFARDLLNSVEPYGILVTVGDNDTFPLWYAQEVEGIRQDVVIANTSLLNTDWYVRQLIRNPIREYDAAKGPAIYRGRNWAKPNQPPIRLTLDGADSIPVAVEVPDTQVFQAGKIIARIAPRILTKADIVVLRMIKDNTDRPVYFSRTSGGYPQELGLGPYVITQGLARRVVGDVPAAGKDTVLVPGEGFLDLPRTRALWDSVFVGPEAMIKRGGWPDKPSVGIPALYIQTGFLLADVLQSSGQTEPARKAMERARAVAKGARVDDLFDFNVQPQPVVPPPGDAPSKLAVPLGESTKGK